MNGSNIRLDEWKNEIIATVEFETNLRESENFSYKLTEKKL